MEREKKKEREKKTKTLTLREKDAAVEARGQAYRDIIKARCGEVEWTC